jgi:hypothetical protein
MFINTRYRKRAEVIDITQLNEETTPNQPAKVTKTLTKTEQMLTQTTKNEFNSEQRQIQKKRTTRITQ